MAKIEDEPLLRNKVHVFRDRIHAGEMLAEKLRKYEGVKEALLIAIPAGGVEVVSTISEKLSLPFDLAITRKLHVPWNKEAGFGAITWDGHLQLNTPLVKALGLSEKQIERCIVEEKEVIERRLKLFRGDKPFPDFKDKIVLIIDDGLASGFSMLTTLQTIKNSNPSKIVVAVPTASKIALDLIKQYANEIICLNVRSSHLFAVADAYELWYDLDDSAVLNIIKTSHFHM